MKNLIEKLTAYDEKVLSSRCDCRYLASVQDIKDIIGAAKDVYQLHSLSFTYGFMQGKKAATAELKKAQVNRNA